MGAVTANPRMLVGTLAAGAKLDRYEILAKLAAGGMATVYVARVQGVAGFERLVAIKVLHANLAHEAEFISMFLDEARLAASIRHPNVVPTIDVSDSKEAGYGYFIVMEYIEGDHLGALLSSAHKANEKLTVPISLRIVADALAGLGAAHDLCDDKGKVLHLVHRDVSPHNIMVGRDGVVRLTDFGVAKAEDRLTHTRDGQVKGKLAYMAPEQAGSGKTDARSDLFSVGVILWETLTGQRLFRAETTAATLNKLIHEPIAAPSSVDPTLAPLDALLAKALARDPAERFQTAEQFMQAIEEAAPLVGGMSSLRGVARAVKQHAAAKLKREKKLVEDAMRALRPADAPEPEEAPADENTSPSSTEISVSSASLSASKVSGVFSHDTQPGARRLVVRRGPEQTVAPETRQPMTTDAPTLRAPAPTAAEAPLVFASSIPVPSEPLWMRHRGLLFAAGALLIAGGIAWAARSGSERAPSVASSPTPTAVMSTVQPPTAASVITPVAPAVPVEPAPAATPAKPSTVTVSTGRPAEPSRGAVGAEPIRSQRAVRASSRRDDVPTSRENTRRVRRDISVNKPPRPDVSSDVMPNPYHD